MLKIKRELKIQLLLLLKFVFYQRLFDLNDHLVLRKNKVPFNMAIGNVELMHECFLFPNTRAWEQQE